MMLCRLLTFALLSSALLLGCAAEETSRDEARRDAEPNAAASSYTFARGDTATITGTLIDTHCYADDHANVGVDHERPQGFVEDCARLCALQGLPVGVLIDGAAEEVAWVLVTTPPVLADYMAETVRVTGVVRSAGVMIPHRVELRQGDEWTFIL